jgi:arylsulfatase A-like enzyme
MAKTPHMDKLAARGTTFLNAHCNAPLCNPSRTSLLLGLRPTTTGIYGLAPWFRTLPEWKDRVALPQHFENHGYSTAATGKIYHGGTGGGGGGKGKGKKAKRDKSEGRGRSSSNGKKGCEKDKAKKGDGKSKGNKLGGLCINFARGKCERENCQFPHVTG